MRCCFSSRYLFSSRGSLSGLDSKMEELPAFLYISSFRFFESYRRLYGRIVCFSTFYIQHNRIELFLVCKKLDLTEQVCKKRSSTRESLGEKLGTDLIARGAFLERSQMVPVFLSFDRYLVNPLNSYGFKLPLQCLHRRQHPSQQQKSPLLANPPLLYPFYKATDRFPLALLAEGIEACFGP